MKATWFKFETSLKDDIKLSRAIDEYGIAALGAYTVIISILTEAENEPVFLKDLEFFSKKYSINRKLLHSILFDFSLFFIEKVDEKNKKIRCFWLEESLEKQKAKALILRENGTKGGRPKENQKVNQTETKRLTKDEPNEKTKSEPNRIRNRIDNTSLDKSTDVLVTREKNALEAVKILEEKPANLEAVANTTTYPPTPFPTDVDADLYRSWLNDWKSNESLKKNVRSESGIIMTDEQIENAIEQFIELCQSSGEIHQNRKDCRRHFTFWVLKKAKELTSKKLTTGEHNLIASEIKLDFSHLRGK